MSDEVSVMTERIKELIESRGGRFLWTNGYVYAFEYAGKYVEICDQRCRIVGSGIDLKYKDKLEEMDRILQRLNRERYQGVQTLDEETGYIDIIINGETVQAVEKLLETLSSKPREPTAKPQACRESFVKRLFKRVLR